MPIPIAMRTKIDNTAGTTTVVTLLDLGWAELFDTPDVGRVVLCVEEEEEDLVDMGAGSVVNVGRCDVEDEVVIVVDEVVLVVDEVVLFVTPRFT